MPRDVAQPSGHRCRLQDLLEQVRLPIRRIARSWEDEVFRAAPCRVLIMLLDDPAGHGADRDGAYALLALGRLKLPRNTDSAIRSVPASKSIARQRSASSSPIRTPVSTESTTIVLYLRCGATSTTCWHICRACELQPCPVKDGLHTRTVTTVTLCISMTSSRARRDAAHNGKTLS